jgi:hypothetical protein
MKQALIILCCVLFAIAGKAQPGSVKTEKYQAEFEKKQSLDVLP